MTHLADARRLAGTLAERLHAHMDAKDRLMNEQRAEVARLRQLERVVLDQLGTSDPQQVAEWIRGARECVEISAELYGHRGRAAAGAAAAIGVTRAALTPDPQPQADGEPTEQDVIGLLRDYTAHVAPGCHPASVDGC